MLAITAAALGLRLWHLGASAIWVDEGVYLHHFRDGVNQIIPHVTKDGYPPLWFFYAYPFYAWGQTEFLMRLSSVLPLVGSLWMTYALGRKLGNPQAGVVGAALLALAPFSLEYSQALKYITLFDLTCLGWFYALLSWQDRPGQRDFWPWYLAWVFIGALALWQHYLAFFTLFAQGIWILGWRRKALWWSAAGVVVMAMSYAPWVLTMKSQTAHLLQFVGWGPLVEHLKAFPFLAYPDVFRAFAAGNYMTVTKDHVPILLVACGVQAAGVLLGFKLWKGRLAWFAVMLITPVICVWTMMMGWGWFFHPRYFSQVFPLYAIFAGSGLAWAWQKKHPVLKALLPLSLAATLFTALGYHHLITETPNVRTASAHIQENFQQGDALVGQPPYMEPLLWFYWRENPGVEYLQHEKDYRIGVTPRLIENWIAKAKARGVKRVWLFQGLGIRNRADQKGLTYDLFKKSAKLVEEEDLFAYPVRFTKEGHWALFDLSQTP